MTSKAAGDLQSKQVSQGFELATNALSMCSHLNVFEVSFLAIQKSFAGVEINSLYRSRNVS